jgi:hypothetical protein
MLISLSPWHLLLNSPLCPGADYNSCGQMFWKPLGFQPEIESGPPRVHRDLTWRPAAGLTGRKFDLRGGLTGQIIFRGG